MKTHDDSQAKPVFFHSAEKISIFVFMRNKLIVIIGPTAVGKTRMSVEVARHLGCSVVSADSRQMFREMTIGTAVPTKEEMDGVEHYFIQDRSVAEYYSAGRYEIDALKKLDELFEENSVQVMTGGSMMYIDAVLKGLDDIPRVSDDVREKVRIMYEYGGLERVAEELRKLDHGADKAVDMKNRQRVIHALEVTIEGKRPYTELLGKKDATRNFDFIKIGLNLPREELYQRINMRVDIMMDEGLTEEAHRLMPLRHLNALNTVGYKELFRYFDGEWTLDYAVNMIKQDTRRYAKRQLTWFRGDGNVEWYGPTETNEIIKRVTEFAEQN